jgi:SAM-dependent methyltransferase
VRATDRLATAVKRHRRLHRAARSARLAVGRVLPPRRFDGVPGRVHFNDFMFIDSSAEEIASYAARAGNVLALIDETLAAAGRSFDDVRHWLDFGCGYGRVLRFLVERVPSNRVSATDVIEEGVAFCASEFGVTPVRSAPELDSVQLGSFDFVYAISVITHLNERNSRAFLRVVGDSLADDGIALFTTHGRWSLEHVDLYGAELQPRAAELERSVGERGIAYVRYPFATNDYGLTWHSREFIEETMAELHAGSVVPLLFKPHGLDGHQDVFAFRRVAPSPRPSNRLHGQLVAEPAGKAIQRSEGDLRKG